jgi:hypothetical protein
MHPAMVVFGIALAADLEGFASVRLSQVIYILSFRI